MTQMFRFKSDEQHLDLWKIGLMSTIKGPIRQVRFYAFNLKIVRFTNMDTINMKTIIPTGCRINKAMSHQVSVVVRLENGRSVMVKIFSNCSIQLTGCKAESDWLEASRILQVFLEETMAKVIQPNALLSEILNLDSSDSNVTKIIMPKNTHNLSPKNLLLIQNFAKWSIFSHEHRIVRMEFNDFVYLPSQGAIVQSHSDLYFWSPFKIAQHHLLSAFPLFDRKSSAFRGILLGPSLKSEQCKPADYTLQCKAILVEHFERQLPQLKLIKKNTSLVTYLSRFIYDRNAINHLKFKTDSELSNKNFTLSLVKDSNRLCMVNGIIKDLPFTICLQKLHDHVQSGQGLLVKDRLLNIYASFINQDTKTLCITVEIEIKHKISFYYYSRSNKISVLGSKDLSWYRDCSSAFMGLLSEVEDK